MTSQTNSRVRLVMCPGCRHVLPESTDIPVYECGGCGTILQAKNQKRDTNDTGVHEADPSQKNGLSYLMSPSTNESDLEKILISLGSGSGCRKEGLGDYEYHSSDVISCHENTESSPDTSGHARAEENQFPLVQYGTKHHNELGDNDIELPGDINAANNILSSPELDRQENKSPGHGPRNLSPSKEDESRRSSENISYGNQNYSQNSFKELPKSTGFSGDVSSCYKSCEDEDLSSVSGTDREVDGSLENHSISRSLAAVSFLPANPEEQIHTAQSSSVASERPDNQILSLSKTTKQAQKETFPVFQSVSSADTSENIPKVYARTDLGVTLRSSTAKRYYDYGFNTSCKELPSQHLPPSRRNFKEAESSSTKGMPKWDELVVNNGTIRENKLPPRPIDSSATLSAKKHYVTKGSKWSQGEFQEPAERNRPFNSRMTTGTGEHWPRTPIYSKDSQVVRSGNCTSSEPTSLPARTVDPRSKTQLLRMVYELQDQLNRAHISEGVTHSGFSSRVAKKEQLPAYNNLFVNGERYPDLSYAFNPGRLDQVKTCFQQGKVPRMAFSGDATHFRHEVDCSCLRCYHQKWHYSAQLPRHAYYDEGHTMLYFRGCRHCSHSPYHSASANPYQYRCSEIPWNHDTMSDGILHKHKEVKKKQQQPAKHHFRPIAGGAPIIACYLCNEILQLPADFLISKRKCHRLRCSACTNVLKFSLVKQNHIIEYNPEPRTPPPSEVSGYAEMTNLTPASCAVDYQHGDPVLPCDGYGQSSHRSSTIESSSLAHPTETLNGTSLRQKMPAGNSLETKKYGKKTIEQDSRNSYTSIQGTFEVGGPSSQAYQPGNVFSEIEEVPAPDGSALHQLMGYPSPRYIK